jgi:hypothetical protein
VVATEKLRSASLKLTPPFPNIGNLQQIGMDDTVAMQKVRFNAEAMALRSTHEGYII